MMMLVSELNWVGDHVTSLSLCVFLQMLLVLVSNSTLHAFVVATSYF